MLAASLALLQNLDVAEPLVGQSNGLMVEQRRLQFLTAQEVATEFWVRMKADERPTYITCGLDSADRKTHIELCDVITIGALPRRGKDSVCPAMGRPLG